MRVKKTHMQTMIIGETEERTDIKLEDEDVEQMDSFKYLGKHDLCDK